MASASSAAVARLIAIKAPVPGFIDIAEAVVPWKGEKVPEAPGVAREPCESGGLLELLLKGALSLPFGSDVNGATRMVLTVARRGARAEDALQGHATLQFFSDDLGLPVNRPKRRSDSNVPASDHQPSTIA